MSSPYCPLQLDFRDPRRWREFVRAALTEGRLFLEYQEIKLRESLGIIRLEALARLYEGDAITPAGFWINAIADDAALSRALDWQVIELQFSRGIAADYQIWLNLTAHTLCDKHFVERLGVALHQFQIAPERLAIELTEQAASREGCLEALTVISERLGVGIVIDDLGTGYSSLETLITAPILAFKLDGSLTRLCTTARGSDLITAFAWLARRWGVLCVAEQVETEVQAQVLWNKGVGGLQGYGVSRIYLNKDFS